MVERAALPSCHVGRAESPPVTWDENAGEEDRFVQSAREIVRLDELEDGRCKASSWRIKAPVKPTYESHFGPGGFNRCIGHEDHRNPTHKDEWGHVFRVNQDGTDFRVLRTEAP